jgi:hypothetical protein
MLVLIEALLDEMTDETRNSSITQREHMEGSTMLPEDS